MSKFRRTHVLRSALALSALAAAGVAFAGSQKEAGASAVSAPAPTVPAVSVDVSESATAQVAFFLHMDGAPAASVYAESFQRNYANSQFVARGSREAVQQTAERAASAEALTRAWELDSMQKALLPRVEAISGVKVLYRASAAVNGIAVMARPDQVKDLAALPGVVRVTREATHEPDAVSSVNFVGTRSFWGAAGGGFHGEGVGVAVIDSGVDFVHTNMGGPGGSNYETGATSVAGGTPQTTFPTSKVVWGYDYAGDAYNAGNNGGTGLPSVTTPTPDANPMGVGPGTVVGGVAASGHGSACASLIAGFGVNADGTTYTAPSDPYTATVPDISAMRISPGIAPQAKVFALRVFGNYGSTNLVSQALDGAVAVRLYQLGGATGQLPPALANLNPAPVAVPASPLLSVVSMSLGSNNGLYSPDDSSGVASQSAAAAGISVVCSAGNSYDSYYVTGSPGTTTGVISVAATYNQQLPAGAATAPASGSLPALSTTFPLGNALFTTATNNLAPTSARYANPPLGNFYHTPGNELTVALQNDAGQPVTDASGNLIAGVTNPYAGQVVIIDRGSNSFHPKALAAQRAGAVAVVIANNRPGGVGGLSAVAGLPTLTIPVNMCPQDAAALFTATGQPNTPPVRPGLLISLSPENAANADNIADYSSRGPRRFDSLLKPDMAAPAENVTVLAGGTGNGVMGFNGTSSACPHVSGAMALLRQMTGSAGPAPAWTMEELKALMLNTPTGVPLVGGAAGTVPFGFDRVGVGRLNLNPAGGMPTAVAMSTDADFPVSVSFGPLDVPTGGSGTSTFDKTVRVVNKAASSRTFNLSFQDRTTVPGVSYSFPDGNSVTVGANSTATFRVRLTGVAAQMRHAIDPSTTSQQVLSINAATTPPTIGYVPRTFPTTAAGRVVLTEQGGAGQTMILAAHALPRPTSNLSVTPATLTLPASSATQSYAFAGPTVNTGSNTSTVANAVADIRAHGKGFELQYNAAPAQSNAFYRTAEITQVGVTSDFASRANPFDTATTNNASAVLTFAVATAADYSTPGANGTSTSGTTVAIQIDTNQNFAAAFAPTVTLYSLAFADQSYSTTTNFGSNMYLAATLPTGSTTLTATGYFTNVLAGVPANSMNTNVQMLSVNAQRLGLTAAASRFRYRVVGSFYFGTYTSTAPSTSTWMTYDLSRPGVDASGLAGTADPFVYFPTAGNTMPVAVNSANFRANGSLGMLAVFPHNAAGARTQAVLASGTGSTNRLSISSFSPGSGTVGSQVTVTGTGFTGATGVSFGSTPVVTFSVTNDSTITATVPVGAMTSTIRVTTPAGTAASKSKFVVIAPR